MATVEETFAGSEPQPALKSGPTTPLPVIGEMGRNEESKAVIQYLAELEKTARRLQTYGQGIVVCTLLNIFGVLTIVSFIPPNSAEAWKSSVLVFSVSFSFLVIMIVFFEQARRNGDAIFDEVVDELSWDIKGRSKKIADERPDLKVRVILRAFVKAEELPLIPGKLGPAGYIAANLLVLIVIILVQTSFRFR